MNYWVEKSIKLAQGKGYLDKLSLVYPVSINTVRKLSSTEKQLVEEAYGKRSTRLLIETLFSFKRFPVDDPYIGFLRKDASAIKRNPKTVKRIGQQLFRLGPVGIVKGIERPKSSSRQFGQHFKNYASKLGYPVLNEEDFLKSKGIAFLEGGDAKLKKFAKTHLGYRGGKGLDLVFRIENRHFIGEAKFISTPGGTQDKSFRETMSFVSKRSQKAEHIAIVDGVVWAPTTERNLYGKLRKLPPKKLIMSALLLKQFIASTHKLNQ